MIYKMPSQDPKSDTRNSTLLVLPSEMRSRIFEYALTFDGHPLFMREDTRINRKIGFNLGMPYEAQTALPLWVNPPNSMKLCLTPELHAEANQLKYVCRQLYRETRCLAIVYNPITFIRTDDQEFNALRQCARFIKHCSIVWTCQLQTIILQDTEHGQGFECRTAEDNLLGKFQLIQDQDDSQHPLNIVAYFCTAHAVEIIWRNPYIHNQGDRWQDLWCRMVQIRTECMRPIPPFLYGDQSTDLYKNVVVPSSNMAIQLWIGLYQCDNVRIFPYEDHFDEEKFRKQIRKDKDVQRDVLVHVPGGLETWVRVLRKLYRTGM